VDSINLRAIPRILRIEGLIPFTLCAILIGFAVTLWEVGLYGADWFLFIIAGVAALLIHIDGHLWNDIMDLEIDRREKSRETGRDRPLVYGWATIDEYRKLSAVIVVVVIILAAYLTTQRVFIPVLIILGLLFDYGYNHPRIALAHHPFTEWYIFPWLVVGVTVTVVYAATGIFSLLALILSLLHGLTVTCFVVSMMRRDARSDRLGGKYTSSVVYPDLPHSTVYGMATLIISVLMLYPLATVLENRELAYVLILTTALVAGINTLLGARIDQLSTRSLHSAFPDFEREANKLMLKQAGVSVVHALAISAILVVSGGIA
jgi:1,4-dihydroxy-2-naphthoate octaprenyltransferase